MSWAHPVGRPLVRMYVHNSSLHDGPFRCNLAGVDSSDNDLFTLAVNRTLVTLSPGREFGTSTESGE